MNDFLMWFVMKHWVLASVLFPEVVLVWAVWMRFTVWACWMTAFVFTIRGVPLLASIVKIWRGRE